jgi:hypothetical protein
MWLLSWWPHAIAHLLNPVITPVVWAPPGFDLAWTTSMPLAALLAAPLTRFFGPIASYNALTVIAPAAAAWCAFLMCRGMSAEYGASLVGGYVFGFSAYMLAEARGHLPVMLVFPLPLVMLIAFQRITGRLSNLRFSLILGTLLVASLLLWSELYATITFFGAIAFGLGWLYGDTAMRERLRQSIVPAAIAYALSLVALLPYLYYFFQSGYPRSQINSPRQYSADLLNLLLPTPVNALGSIGLLQAVTSRFTTNSIEAGAYFGLPLIAITCWYFWEHWREPMTRALFAFILIVCVFMFGPRLHINGDELFGMPWKIPMHLPLLRHALPVRFSVYAFLALAIIVSRWLSVSRPMALKLGAIGLLAVSLCPNLCTSFWSSNIESPDFFANGDYRRILQPEENVVILPYGMNGASMLWQALAGFYFRVAGGWTSITPREFESWPVVNAMLTRTYLPEMTLQLRAFMAAHGVQTVIVSDAENALWQPILSQLDPSPVQISGVAVYRTAANDTIRQGLLSALEMERRSNLGRFSVLLSAASGYLAKGGNLSELTPLRAQRLGLLPPHWVTDPDVRTHNGLYLGPWDGDQVAIGVVGSYEGLQPVIKRYRGATTEIFFPFPKKLAEPPHGDTFMRLLVMVFDRAYFR